MSGENPPARCPCGQIPSRILGGETLVKWAYAYGDCCGEWSVEYRQEWARSQEEADKLAREAWDAAARAPEL